MALVGALTFAGCSPPANGKLFTHTQYDSGDSAMVGGTLVVDSGGCMALQNSGEVRSLVLPEKLSTRDGDALVFDGRRTAVGETFRAGGGINLNGGKGIAGLSVPDGCTLTQAPWVVSVPH